MHSVDGRKCQIKTRQRHKINIDEVVDKSSWIKKFSKIMISKAHTFRSLCYSIIVMIIVYSIIVLNAIIK